MAFSILGHRTVAMRILDEARKDPGGYPSFLSTIAADERLTAYYLGGTEAPDLGALCHVQRPNIQYNTHYEHPGLWIRLLFEEALTDKERAFAWGWVVHQAADLQLHPWMNAQNLNYCEVKLLHPLFECAIDSTVGTGLAECRAYSEPDLALTAVDLLRRVTTLVASVRARSVAYDDYVAEVRQRCVKCGDEPGEWRGIDSGVRAYFDLGVATGQFHVVKAVELTAGANAVDTPFLRAAIGRAGRDADSPALKRIASVLSDALESGSTASCSISEAATELAELYSANGAPLRERLWAAARGEWRQLDQNFDSGAPVNDPALYLSFDEGVDVALVIDSSGSMKENDPTDLRKRAAELLVDRTEARFTVVRFNHEVSALAEKSADRVVLQRAISQICAEGGTRICQATRYALEKLGGAERRGVVVLLTDGKSQDTCPAGEFSSQGIPIFTVGLSPDANGAMLQALAAVSGGTYIHARDATDVQSAFDAVMTEALGEATIAVLSGTARPGEATRFRFAVDATIRALSVLLTWPGSTLNLELISPSGKQRSARVEGRSGGTYETLRIESPEAGTWSAVVHSVDVPASGEPFQLRAAAVTPVRVALDPDPSSSVSTRATLQGFSSKPHVNVRVERPDGRSDSAEVTADGNGFVATYAAADQPGAYSFVWHLASGDTSRFATRAIFVGSAGADGGKAISVEGQYVRWDRGAMYGVRPGLGIRIVRSGKQIAAGRVIDVRPQDADIELDSVSGLDDVVVGDSVEVEMTSWTADVPP